MISKRARTILIIVVVALFLLCAMAAGGYWATGPSLRCNLPEKGLADEGWSARIVTAGGVDRCYYLYTPPGYDPSQPAPLVVSFHGFMSNPDSHGLITHWHQLAAEEGFLLAYPQGSGYPQRWNAAPGWAVDDVDDVQFFLDIVADVSAAASVDPARVYVSGFSNGGGMAERVGCELADQVAAMGTVAGAVRSMEECSPSRPVPAMVFHGTADPVVIYEGGEVEHVLIRTIAESIGASITFMGAEWVGTWATLNGCDPTPEALAPSGGVRGLRYTGCRNDAEVIFYAINEGGHTWPGGFPIPVGKTSQDIDATEELWRFFEQHSLDAQP